MIDSVKDHLVSQISQKKTARKMFRASRKLFEDNNINCALALRNQLSNLKMSRLELVTSYFMRISKLRDQLSTIGESLDDRELVMTTLNGLPPWEPFIQSLSGRSKFLNFYRLWEYCTHEETRLVVEFDCMELNMNRTNPLHLMLRTEKVRE